MPMFVIEREFAEQLDALEPDGLVGTIEYNDDHELRWLFSFLSADRKKTYCVYEATDADALRRQAEDLGIPADVITEVGEINPEMFSKGTTATGNLAS